jgi:asparagine synthetase B (glutamine-hydrolysing)
MFRSLLKKDVTFKEGIVPKIDENPFEKKGISSSEELASFLKREVQEQTKDGKAALMLSGGIDSAILAKYMPRGSVAYTLKCVVPGVKTIDETEIAANYAKKCGLVHKVIEVYWEDYLKLMPSLFKRKGAPFHSIEPQICKAAIIAKNDGFEKLIFGKGADSTYGGLDGLLSKDWETEDFIKRLSFVMPNKVLKDSIIIKEPFLKHENNNHIDPHEFIKDILSLEATGSYTNACKVGGVSYLAPYEKTYLAKKIDYKRIRSGESKYFIREVFAKEYKDFNIPRKIPMPRPVNEWFANWEGPKRAEFLPNCVEGLSGDQKWLVYILEKYLDSLGI